MPAFALTPANPGGFPPVTSLEFPNFIQFRFNGVDLGGPDATVLNVVGGSGITLERGTGADANKVTLTIA